MCKYIQTEGGSQPGKYWHGSPLITCDFCKTESPDCFVDGRVIGGTQWATMCIPCFKTHGAAVGYGEGQKYCKQA
jgi:hypothetical protein